MVFHHEDSPTYIAYTDSGHHISRNGGAYAYILLRQGEIVRKEASLFFRESNNRGELHAIIAAIENLPEGADVEIRTDSQYAVNTLTGEWRQRRNTDLFARWHELVRGRKLKVKVVWIRAHTGDFYNQMCDDLCCETMTSITNYPYISVSKPIQPNGQSQPEHQAQV